MAGPTATTPKLWLECDVGVYKDAGSTLCADGDTSQQWNDQSGNGNHVTQSGATARPTYHTNKRNGLPTLTFDGSNDCFSSPCLAEPKTVFCVIKNRVNGNNYTPIGGDVSGGSTFGAYYYQIANDNRLHAIRETSGTAWNANTGVVQMGDATWYTLKWRWNGTSKIETLYNLFESGNMSSDTGGTGSTSSVSAASIGAGWFAHANVDFISGEVAEVLIYDVALSDAEMAQIDYYLFHKWGFGQTSTIQYRMSNFIDPGSSNESLRCLESADGATWSVLPVNYVPHTGNVVRDPSMFYDLAGTLGTVRRWWLAHTNVTGVGTSTSFDVAYSDDDGQSWTYNATVDCTGISGINRCWAPEWFVDHDGTVHVLFAASTDNANTFDIYERHTTDGSTFSAPSKVTGLDAGAYLIDPFMVYTGGGYYLWVRYSAAGGGGGEARVYKSSSPFSGYSTWRSGTWQGFGGTIFEGHSVILLNTGVWRDFADQLPGGTVGIKYSDQTAGDWTGSGSTTWSTPTIVAIANDTYVPRHGTVVYQPPPPPPMQFNPGIVPGCNQILGGGIL